LGKSGISNRQARRRPTASPGPRKKEKKRSDSRPPTNNRDSRQSARERVRKKKERGDDVAYLERGGTFLRRSFPSFKAQKEEAHEGIGRKFQGEKVPLSL